MLFRSLGLVPLNASCIFRCTRYLAVIDFNYVHITSSSFLVPRTIPVHFRSPSVTSPARLIVLSHNFSNISRELLDDLAETRVGTHDQAQGSDQHQAHIFRYHNLPLVGPHYFPECAYLYDCWESQSQTRQTKCTE